ncbi:MAG: PTS sugar transporter subunit IIA [Polyangiaceae bacterium]
MRLSDILSEQRVLVDVDGTAVVSKDQALKQLGSLLSAAIGITDAEVYRLLLEREKLQSTGIGDSVAIPHASTDDAPGQAAALVVCPGGIEFEAIDGAPVRIIFGVIGPRRATGEHLRTLARISRLLRDPATRSKLIASPSAALAHQLVVTQDATL